MPLFTLSTGRVVVKGHKVSLATENGNFDLASLQPFSRRLELSLEVNSNDTIKHSVDSRLFAGDRYLAFGY